MKVIVRAASLALVSVGASSCLPALREPTTPVRTDWHQISEVGPEDSTLLILLPGKRSRASDFEEHGFIDAISPDDRIDVVTVDLHFGYYRDRTVVDRLREDVVIRAQQRGYRKIEIVGISLGGLGGIIYTLERPGEIERLTLLAPFIGDETITEEIQSAGGLTRWEAGEIDSDDFQRRLWQNLKRWLPDSEEFADRPEIRLGVGEADRVRSTSDFFSQELLDGRIVRRPGGHDWDSWTGLYQYFFQLEKTPS